MKIKEEINPFVLCLIVKPNVRSGLGFMVFNATFNNISVISWRSKNVRAGRILGNLTIL